MADQILARGELAFTVQARLLRELGERLVRRPEVALVELIKNSYDADANECHVTISSDVIKVTDDGHGMTLEQFTDGWMAVGTGAKSQASTTQRYQRAITGEKGIGRFSVRFLGRELLLRTVANDPARGRTLLTAEFHWPAFDAAEDLGQIKVPYELRSVGPDAAIGTTLEIAQLRHNVTKLDLKQVRTASFGLLSPLRSLIETYAGHESRDPGFRLLVSGADDELEDVGETVLDHFALRATLVLEGSTLSLRIWTGVDETSAAVYELVDTLHVDCGDVRADLRFFPRREGMFRGIGVDGRIAHGWISDNGGVAVFDRAFRVSPYGEPSDDWLRLDADNARNYRRPRSSLAAKHFPMGEGEQSSTSENWMLRLPQSRQMVGVVQVQGLRQSGTAERQREGLIAAADREGFVVNEAYEQLVDLVRGAVEAIAMVDRRQQQEAERRRESERLLELQEGVAEALADLEADPEIPKDRKRKLATAIRGLAEEAKTHEQVTQERTRQLEVMSLLGVVAGYMTHEFGVALDAIRRGRSELEGLVEQQPALAASVAEMTRSESALLEFLNYSRLYIRGATKATVGPYVAAYRINRVKKIYGRYAADRGIEVQVQIDPYLPGPAVPAALYDGIALNLYTNALKAVTAASRRTEARIRFTAWTERDEHVLEVSDTGVGIPAILRERVFEPLFTTTASENDPLGSGLGLGLSLVRNGAQAFGGQVRIVSAAKPFSTCVQVRLPKGVARE